MRTETQTQRDYLEQRSYAIYNDKDRDLRKQFNLIDDEAPKSAKEALERIKNGLYTLPKYFEEEMDEDSDFGYDHYSVMSHIAWRDPKRVADQAGFDAAVKVLKKEFSDVRDAIAITPPEEGLKALKAFEAKKFN